ncbi:hypothetical protein ABZ249_30130 [Nocardiopsis sp. NPDC006139]|uniref:hypothetical protein n=1 Tax=Nocardiopsis sp. NPDC006139 TaxID=3154578 RepID=UPI0033B6B750
MDELLAQLTPVIVQLIPVIIGALIGWGATTYQANRTHKLQTDRDRQVHYEKLLRHLHAERAKGFIEDDFDRFENARLMLGLIPPGHGRRQKRRISQIEAACVGAIEWMEHLQYLEFRAYSGVRGNASGMYLQLADHAVQVISAAYHGNPIPGRPDYYDKLEAGSKAVDEHYEMINAEREADELERLEEEKRRRAVEKPVPSPEEGEAK